MIKECLRLTDNDLSRVGRERIEWAWRKMPVLQQIKDDWEQSLPLKGIKIAACLHISAKTANLARVLKSGGADLALCASNPLSTQDDIAAALNVFYDIPTFARRGVDNDAYYSQINAVLDIKPDLTIDDGADRGTTPQKKGPGGEKVFLGGRKDPPPGGGGGGAGRGGRPPSFFFGGGCPSNKKPSLYKDRPPPPPPPGGFLGAPPLFSRASSFFFVGGGGGGGGGGCLPGARAWSKGDCC